MSGVLSCESSLFQLKLPLALIVWIDILILERG